MFNEQQQYYTQQPMMNYQFPQVKEPSMTQPLTPDQISELKNSGKFDFSISPTDLLKAKCTHKQNGKIVLQPTSDGKLYCPICKESFSEQELSEIEVAEFVERMVDIMQTIKTYYVDMPMDVAQNFFQFMPLLQKMPHMYKIAIENFKSHENQNLMNVNQMNQTLGFNAYNAMITPSAYPFNPMMGQPMMQPQMMQQPQQMYQQPQMAQQPQQMMGQPMMNAFGSYAQPPMQQQMMYQQPQMAQPQQMMQPQAAPQPITDNKVGNVQVEKTLNS